MLLGLTGGIASGKSTALRAFARLGVPTLSSDEIVHDLYRTAAVRDEVVALLGRRVLGPDGAVDRSRVAERAFADPEILGALERLLHPLVTRELERWRATQEAGGPALLVHEVPLLFEAGLQSRYDATVLVTAPDDVRAARDPDRFAERRPSQMSEESKASLATYVYVNTGTPQQLEDWVRELVRGLAG
jgi:dephospho-CoA kinase